ncbi:putative protein serine/threonine kinase [Tieghemostelium lacteum]|uniref:non-specific serine/threonine protein kinase n=1 Tax=Tieghemostelium lacteum TaxID=361077 RepID=A0A151Z621_TIELA|nr:putative protein serine/threonine kinase [Tieghemostelium lacteum]|eukprot:KYQ89395.1 putative protein serine/threonine kinase [Tieghemostelium lacteum]
MADDLTQACTVDVGYDDEGSNLSEKKIGWAILKSMNPAYPDYQLIEDSNSFGRLPASTFHFNDKVISGTHCTIFKEPTTNDGESIIAFILDQSTNGTYVDGVRIGKGNKQLLVKDQEISFNAKTTNSERISFIYRPLEKEVEEEGGPQKKYMIGETLGSGNFATVKLAVDRKSGEKYAIKIIDKKKYFMNSSSRKDALMDEVNILKGLNHQNIIHIQEVFETDKTLYLVLELVQGGELLNDILNSMFYQELKAKLLFYQIVEGVKYLHDRGIAHRDLKPENILLKRKGEDLDPQAKDSIKLSDFGLSRTVNSGSLMTTMCGTPQYLAPEIIMGTGAQGGYGKEVDCWSMGAILYIMLCGYPPFDESKDISIFEQIRKAIFDFPSEDWDVVSNEAKDLIKRLLNVNPAKRYSCSQILEHPWFNPNASLEKLIDEDLRQQTQSSSFNSGSNSSLSSNSSSVLGKRKSDDSLFSNHSNDNDVDDSDNVQKKLKQDDNNNNNNSNNNDGEDEDTDDDSKSTNVKSYRSSSNLGSPPIPTTINSNNSSPVVQAQPVIKPSHYPPPQATTAPTSYAINTAYYNNNIITSSPPTTTITKSPPSSPTIKSQPVPQQPPQQSIPQQPVPLATSSMPPSAVVDNRPMCKYGTQCYRKNPSHFSQFKHPLPS